MWYHGVMKQLSTREQHANEIDNKSSQYGLHSQL